METSGAADPRPVAAALQRLCRLDQVAAVLDAASAASLAATPLGAAQLLAADVVLLNKCDAATAAELDAAEAVVRYPPPPAPRQEAPLGCASGSLCIPLSEKCALLVSESDESSAAARIELEASCSRLGAENSSTGL